MVKTALRIVIALFILTSANQTCRAEDPNDPFDLGSSEDLLNLDPNNPNPFQIDSAHDDEKSADQLVNEATYLFTDSRPLDARTKLLKALSKEPKNYKAHTLLGGYYLATVGHFRLALKYVKQAETLFLEKNGEPPYKDEEIKSDHARILYLLSETRLNLDNYEGALETLDYFNSYYYGSWYPGSRAWVLMKLGRLEEAVKVARIGMLAGAEPGRTLNILGILLSMTDRDKESLEILNKAILYEFSLGSQGQPATPLNNSGEVYHEMFEEDKAEASWVKATSMPDGCEHVLPALNLSLLMMEQLRFKDAKRAMDGFESCVAQYPLRNGEEHRALVHLARGRIDMHTGKIDSALEHFEGALERRQWFGKIGTSSEDMSSASLVSLAQALRRKNNILSFKRDLSWPEWLLTKKDMIVNSLRADWLMREARQVLAEDLSNFEDLKVRNTDSMLEYHTVGEILAGFSAREAGKRISDLMVKDKRPGAEPYYRGYLAQNLIEHGKKSEGLKLVDKALGAIRDGTDSGIKVQLLLLTLRYLEPGSPDYNKIAVQIYQLAPAELRNFGFRLPVNSSGLTKSMLNELESSAFIPLKDHNLRYTVFASEDSEGYHFEFTSTDRNAPVKVQDAKLEKAVDLLADGVFSQSLG